SFFAELVSRVEYTVPISQYNPDGVVVNTNWLLRNGSPYYYEAARGVKTGGFDSYYTRDADGDWVKHDGVANLVSVAQRNVDGTSYRYMVVTMGAPWLQRENRDTGQQGLHHAFNDHKTLYSWAFSTFWNACVMRATDPIDIVKVLDGDADEVQLFPLMDSMSSEFWTLLPKNLDVDSTVNKITELASDECTCGNPGSDECVCDIRAGVVSAPIEKGQLLGTVELQLAGQPLTKIQLVAGDSVARTGSAIARDRVSSIFGKRWFVPLLLLLGATVIVLIILSYIRKHRKRLEKARKKPPNRRIRR
ncbi:MAG: hypothetical protein FWH07_01485, partial [Oscillospiraceae bacterium]|nr:hypothetical protein [Oscillospiraceae bacterium]